MNGGTPLPLMRNLPRGPLPAGRQLVLASGSPRRAELLRAAGYPFRVELPSPAAEDAVRADETAEQAVRRLAFQKAADVAARAGEAIVLAADTVAWCDGHVLGKPADRDDAARMIRRLAGRTHHVYTGICLWDVAAGRYLLESVDTELEMMPLGDAALEEHLDSLRWQGKAGAFGYQDDNDWLRIVGGGSESNVVGLPMERLAEMLGELAGICRR